MEANKIVEDIKKDAAGWVNSQAYFTGNNPTIKDLPKQEAPDIRVAVPIARKAVNTVTGYVFNDIRYTTGEGYQETLDEILKANEYKFLDYELSTQALTHGSAYEVHWYDPEEGEQFGMVPGKYGKMYYTDSIKPKKIMFAYITEYQEGEDPVTKLTIYDSEAVRVYKIKGEEETLIEENPHAYEVVPVVEYRINREGANLFSHVTDMIDQLDSIYSRNIGNELSKVASSLLTTNMYLSQMIKTDEHGRNQTQVDSMIDGKKWIFQGMGADDFLKWVEKNVQEGFVFGAGDRFERMIYDQLQVPNFSDAEQWGNQVSGVAAAYRLLGFDNLCNSIFAYFRRGLDDRMKLIGRAAMAFYRTTPEPVEIRTERQLPRNVLENSQIARNLVGIAPNAKILELFDFIEDPEEAAALMQEQKRSEGAALLGGAIEPR